MCLIPLTEFNCIVKIIKKMVINFHLNILCQCLLLGIVYVFISNQIILICSKELQIIVMKSQIKLFKIFFGHARLFSN